MMRLSNATLAGLTPAIATPGYDRAGVTTGIVHLGLGAFHRGHQAVMTDDLLAQDPLWGILGVSLRSSDVRDALTPQDNLYSLNVMDGTGARRRIIGALTGVLVAPENPAAVIDALSAPGTRIVSTTVTEKGYSHDPATGVLREDDPDIRHDLANPEAPRTTLGMIAQGLRRRRAAGLKPFTVLACDNLPSNGHTLRGLVLRFARLLDRDFAAWVEDEVRFPSTMVDRIVPATTEADRISVSAALGLDDAAPIMTEP
ncbi:MAG: mannitol dehydrogenase family protein, partial [Proteobacteria bacterium]|nr:mannitol dehydrogenase family protein [Pseudomonadota bacterium]